MVNENIAATGAQEDVKETVVNAEGQEQASEKEVKQADKTFTVREMEAEADRRATKAAETAVRNFIDKELPKRLEAERTEAERAAKMTAEEKAQAEAQKREKELQEREQQINRRELKAFALEQKASPRSWRKSLLTTTRTRPKPP